MDSLNGDLTCEELDIIYCTLNKLESDFDF